MENVVLLLPAMTDCRGRTYDRFHARRDPGYGPGWYVFGRNEGYGDRLYAKIATPDHAPRRHRSYNCKVVPGWPTKAQAQAIADRLNAGVVAA